MKKLTILIIFLIVLLQGCKSVNKQGNPSTGTDTSGLTEQHNISPKINEAPLENQDGTGNANNWIDNQSPNVDINEKQNTNNNGNQSNESNNNTKPKNPSTNNATGSNSNNTGANNGGTEDGTALGDSSTKPPASSSLPTIASNYDSEYLSAIEEQVLVLVNNERNKAGLSSLSMSSSLRQASRYKANEMLQYNYFSHSSPYTNDPWDVAKAYGHSYSTFGENNWTMSSSSMSSLKSSLTAETIVSSWMNSPGHRANILKGNFKRMGIGVVIGSNGKCYASQMLSD